MASLEEVVRGAVLDGLAEFFDEDETCPCGEGDERCPELVDSEAALVAIIKGLRDKIATLENDVAELKKGKPYIPVGDDTGMLKDLYDRLPFKPLDDRWNPGLVFYCR